MTPEPDPGRHPRPVSSPEAPDEASEPGPGAVRVPERLSSRDAEALFSRLPPVSTDALTGFWRGRVVDTGHPYDSMLRASCWIGKEFLAPERVHPLVHEGAFGRLRLDPGRIPLRLARALGLAHWPGARAVARIAGPLFATSRPRARLRTVLDGDEPTAAMIYDQRPIIDVFRRVDAATVMGRMDEKGAHRPAFFLLTREA